MTRTTTQSYSSVIKCLLSLLGAMYIAPPVSASETTLPPIFSYQAHDMDSLRQGFAEPPREAAPWVYWFWWNGVLSEEELERELAELAAAGIGGVEIRCVTFHGWSGKRPSHMDPESLRKLGHRQVEYLSDDFLDLLQLVCRQAERLGLRVAVNMGQGWPPGGPWISDRHRTKNLSWEPLQVTGPSVLAQKDLPPHSFVLAWKVDPASPENTIIQESFVDLSDKIQLQDGQGSLRWNVPAGEWLIGLFRVIPGAICDKGDGPEVDPASREAVLFHLNHFFGRLDSKLQPFYGTTFVDVASDSWEYINRGKRYWSPAILDAFPGLAGYDLREKMYALLGYGPDASQVHEDLLKVERALIHENFFVTAADFLHQRGLRHRPQVYGRGLARDFLQAYALADIPEMEHGCVLPEAPWAAHIMGRPIVSCESFTFLSRDHEPIRFHNGPWEETPALLRWHANHFYSQGVNRIQVHSFSYSPPQLPPPGWRMYAEVHFNRTIPWWPDLPCLTTWMSRQQWMLQAGQAVTNVLVYPVKPNPLETPYNQMGDIQPVSAANAVDGANAFTLPAVVRRAQSGDYQPNSVCVLGDITTTAEAKQLFDLLDGGARLICCQKLPADWTALQGRPGEALRQRAKALQSAGRLIDARNVGWKQALNQQQALRWEPEQAHLVYQHRRVRDGELYFIVNYGDPFSGQVSFPHQEMQVEVWDADTGHVRPAAAGYQRGGRTHVTLQLGHFESALVTFTPGQMPVRVVEADSGTFHFNSQGALIGLFDEAGRHTVTLSSGSDRTLTVDLPESAALAGPWQLDVPPDLARSPVPDVKDSTLDRLVSWREVPGLRRFAGTVAYTTQVSLSADQLASDLEWQLDLGRVYEVARVWVNGDSAGTAWFPPFRLDVTRLLRPGSNTVKIEVANLLKNYLADSEEYSRPSNLLGADSEEYARPSGLLGPVKLTPRSRQVVWRPADAR